MELNRRLFTETARLVVVDNEAGTRVERHPDLLHYAAPTVVSSARKQRTGAWPLASLTLGEDHRTLHAAVADPRSGRFLVVAPAAEVLPRGLLHGTQHVVYWADEDKTPLGCGTGGEHSIGGHENNTSFDENVLDAYTPCEPYTTHEVALINYQYADYAFTSQMGGASRASNRMSGTVNHVRMRDAYLAAASLRPTIQRQEVHTTQGGPRPWNSYAAQNLDGYNTIVQFQRDYSASGDHYGSDAGLLFVSDRRPLNGVAGMNYVDALCGRYSVGFSRYISSLDSMATVASHELAHGVGAAHDQESDGTCGGCSDDPTCGSCGCEGFIMDFMVNSATEFSPCSVHKFCKQRNTRSSCVWGGYAPPPPPPAPLPPSPPPAPAPTPSPTPAPSPEVPDAPNQREGLNESQKRLLAASGMFGVCGLAIMGAAMVVLRMARREPAHVEDPVSQPQQSQVPPAASQRGTRKGRAARRGSVEALMASQAAIASAPPS